MLLSVLLGTHPPQLPARALVRAGAAFGVPDGTVRVALSRMAAEGDVLAEDGTYRLADRLVERQRLQDEARAAATTEWDGTWELAVADPGERGGRSRLATSLGPLRLAEWRDGVWARPANLRRPTRDVAGVRWARTGRLGRDVELAGALWDLEGWAARARRLLGAMAADPDPPTRFAVSAAVVAHLRQDPLLPAELLGSAWPGGVLRASYGAFEAELTALLRAAWSAPEASARHSAT